MGRTAGAFRFLAYAVLAMNHRWLCGVQGKMQLEALVDRLQLLRLTLPGNLPIAIPDALIAFADPGDSRPGPVGAFGMKELAAIQITQCQMSEINVAHVPGICFSVIAARGAAEKRQLKSKTAAIASFHVSGVVPPLGLEIRMIKVVARKRVAVARKRGASLRAGIQRQEYRRQASPYTPHEP